MRPHFCDHRSVRLWAALLLLILLPVICSCALADGERNYYALIIGENYIDAPKQEGKIQFGTLPACSNDARAMEVMLKGMSATPYRVTTLINPTRKEILQAIPAAFAGSTGDDICLFYYSGHGEGGTGNLVPYDVTISGMLKLTDLKIALNSSCPGTKLVIMDSCYSGNMVRIGDVSDLQPKAAPDLDETNARIISVFTGDGDLYARAAGNYLVLTASRYDEMSYTYAKTFSVFTYYLQEGSGFLETEKTPMATMAADTDKNGYITLQEAYRYAYDAARNFMKIVSGSQVTQHAQISPAGSTAVIWGRYAVTSGFNADWQKGDETLTFGVNVPAEELSQILVDGSPVDPVYYTVSEASDGTAAVTLSREFLAGLDIGKHKLACTNKDGKRTYNSAAFTVSEPAPPTPTPTAPAFDLPVTGDSTPVPVYILLAAFAAILLTALRRRRA